MIFSGMNLSEIIFMVPIVLLALTGHEFAHGFVSYKLGDPTPKYEGRLSFNPMAHLDPIGTLLMIFTGFGWAKPVAINPMYYKNRRVGMVIVALAGPLANFVMAFIGLLLYYTLAILSYKTGISGSAVNLVLKFFAMFASANISLMVFNLIPIPPLDGSRVLDLFLPDEASYKLHQVERYSMLLIMLLSVSGTLSKILGVGIDLVYNLLDIMLGTIFKMFI